MLNGESLSFFFFFSFFPFSPTQFSSRSLSVVLGSFPPPLFGNLISTFIFFFQIKPRVQKEVDQLTWFFPVLGGGGGV